MEVQVGEEELEKARREQKNQQSKVQNGIDLRKVNIKSKLYQLGDGFGNMLNDNADKLTNDDLNRLNKLEGTNLANNVTLILLNKGVDCAAALGISKEEVTEAFKNKMDKGTEEQADFIVKKAIEKQQKEQNKEVNLIGEDVKQKVSEIRKELQENRQRSQSAAPKRKAEPRHVENLLNKRNKSQSDNKENRSAGR